MVDILFLEPKIVLMKSFNLQNLFKPVEHEYKITMVGTYFMYDKYI